MNLISEIWDKNLPNFGYVIDSDNDIPYVIILGGQSIPKGDARNFREAIFRRNEEMQQLYCQESLSDNQKQELAQLMGKMFSLCECREEGLYTREEQSAFIDKLSEKEKKQLERQVQMLKDCRSFYRDYVFRG